MCVVVYVFVLSLLKFKKGMGEIMVVLIKGLKSGDRELKRESEIKIKEQNEEIEQIGLYQIKKKGLCSIK